MFNLDTSNSNGITITETMLNGNAADAFKQDGELIKDLVQLMLPEGNPKTVASARFHSMSAIGGCVYSLEIFYPTHIQLSVLTGAVRTNFAHIKNCSVKNFTGSSSLLEKLYHRLETGAMEGSGRFSIGSFVSGEKVVILEEEVIVLVSHHADDTDQE